MIIFGWGKVTRHFLGVAARQQCRLCNQLSEWQLCVMRTWFTLFFIPIIPYKTVYCIMCSNCNAYMEIEKERFDQIKSAIQSGEEEAFKYAGKTPTQIAYLKAQEAARNQQNES